MVKYNVLALTVRTVKPVIVKMSEDQHVTEGDDCHFEAVVTGKPHPDVEWCVESNVFLLLFVHFNDFS